MDYFVSLLELGSAKICIIHAYQYLDKNNCLTADTEGILSEAFLEVNKQFMYLLTYAE